MSTSRSLSSRVCPWSLAGICLVAALLIKPVQERVDRSLMDRPTDPDLLYFNTPAVVKRMALGYESLLADVYWMRAIQYYGRREEAARRPVRYKNLAALFDITTTLDPRRMDVFRAGGVFLAEPEPLGAGEPEKALRLLDKGISSHPEEWRLRFDKGFICFWFLKDFSKAGEVWLAASRLPTAPPWMEGLAAMAISKAGAVETARAIWQRQYLESDRADIRSNAWNHLASIQVNEDLWTLEFLLEKYKEKNGSLPVRLEELTHAGFPPHATKDPSGTPYLYDRTSGTVRLDPATRMRYLEVPFDYKGVFLEKLARTLSAPRSR